MTEDYKPNDPRLRPPLPSAYPWAPLPTTGSDSAKVSVSLLESSELRGPAELMSSFAKAGEKWTIPAFSFLVAHGEESLLFDLGCREDPENFTPVNKPALETFEVKPHPHPVTRLTEGKYDLSRIQTVIISHRHFDHFGNLDTLASFDPQVVVGPGALGGIGKGYPEDEKSPWPSSWLRDRRIVELPTPGGDGQLKSDGGRKIHWECFDEALDWYGDGSFWLVYAPGHVAGQMMGLARVTTSPPTYILLGADVAHSQETYLPVPTSASDPRGTEPVKDGRVPFLEDIPRGVHDIGTLTRMSAEKNVIVVLAHEAPAADVLPRWPESLNDWKERGWKEKKQEGVYERARHRGHDV